MDRVVASSPARKSAYRPHGGVRGAEFPPNSALFEGRFGRMFRTLPGARFSESALEALAEKMTADPESEPTPEEELDDEENIGTKDNPGIAAGYTYLGQFIDHDLTFDPASSLQMQNDPEALVDFRSPRFDLDCVYGRGPDDQPYLYADDGLHMLLGKEISGSFDLPRNNPRKNEPARALIGDPRNDENTIVSQLQSTMLRFHNQVVDFLTEHLGQAPSFQRVQQEVRWHYQWIVLHDFLPTIIGKETLYAILPQLAKSEDITEFTPDLKFYRWQKEPYIPIEFSVAAYRFGHSMIRPIYRLNANIERLFIFPIMLNGQLTDGLTGFKEVAPERGIDWSLFFPMGGSTLGSTGKTRVQPAYKIDTSLVDPLAHLPFSVGQNIPSLAKRNLLRGLRMGLPSGQAVARYMGLDPIPDDALRVGKAIADDAATNPLLTGISPEFQNNAPLWYYILAEAQQEVQKAAKALPGNLSEEALAKEKERIDQIPVRLGPVGGRIVGEVFVGLLFGDSHSYLRQYPGWKPIKEFCSGAHQDQFGIVDLIAQAQKTPKS